MRYGSVCSGIEAATMAWRPLGWTPAFFSEIEKFPSAVLAHHYGSNMPGEAASTNGVPNLGDMTKFQEWPDAAIDVLVGGTPCQSFSVAGLRAGLADPRGNLMLTYLAIAARYQPRWLVWENVPGVLSSNSGRDFGTFLTGLGELGYGFAYRVLDAQFCRAHGHEWAVPQRRRRVFVVGYFGDWRRAAAVLFDAASLRGDSPPRREAGQRVAGTIEAGAARSRGAGTSPSGIIDVSHTLKADGFDASEDGTGRGTPIVPVAPTLRAGGNATGGDRPYGTDVDTCDSLVAEPIVLMERGRADGPNLETRQDGTANAILTPNGGRGGLGVGAVALPIPIDMRQASRGATMTNNRAEGSSGGAPGTGIGEPGDPAPTIASSHTPAVAHAIQAGALRENPDSGPDGIGVQADIAYTVEARAEVQAVAFAENSRGELRLQGGDGQISPQLTTGGGKPGQGQPCVAETWAVRRLTPRECERLMGFPDDYTAIPYRGKIAADGPRYKSLGNSMAVSVMAVIGQRIQMVENMEERHADVA